MYLADLSQERFPGQCRLQDCRLSNERIELAAKFVLKISGLTTVTPPNSSARLCWRVINPSTKGTLGQAPAGRDQNGGSGSMDGPASSTWCRPGHGVVICGTLAAVLHKRIAVDTFWTQTEARSSDCL
jgi:hypothetical protein